MILDAIVGIFGGGVIGVGIKAARDAYVAKKRNEETLARVEAKDTQHEREVTERFAIAALDSKREADDIMREQSAQITILTGKVERCEAKHEAAQRELSLTTQLAERQREEIASLRGEVESLTTQLDDLRDRFDRFVAHAMGVRGISEVPGE